MRSNKFTMKQFGRSAMAVAVGMCFASIAYAQSADGTIFGRVAAKSQVTVVNLENGATRVIQAEADGGFAFSKMQPGRYKVTSGNNTREISVAIGSGTEVKFDEVATVTVSGSRTRSAIDVSSTESNSVFSLSEIQALPVGRNATAVAMLAPGAVQGDTGLGDGNIASIGGASVAENGYYINGFDVTNIRNFLSYANLPFDAIEQQQVKTGGYGAEYGRSLGGVVSISTKRGTNKWKGGASVYWSPSDLASDGKNVKDLEAENNVGHQNYTVFRQPRKADNLSYNAYVGGPIIKDKLFFFGIVEGKKNTLDTFASDRSVHSQSDSPNGMIKLDFLPTDNHRLEFTGITNKQRVSIIDYNRDVTANPNQYFTTSHVGAGAASEQKSGGDVLMGKYTGYLTDNLTISAQVGRVYDQNVTTTGAREQGKDCPVVFNVGATQALGCWTPPFPSLGGRDLKAPVDSDTRESSRFDVEYTLNTHTIRAGYDGQKFTSAEAGGTTYTGGVYWRYFVSPDGKVNGVPGAVAPGAQYVRKRVASSTSGEFEVANTAMYIEDSWKVNKNVLVVAGLRAESFDNKNGDGVSFVKADNLIAPRLGASWDVNGDATLKIYGNAGRYYIPVASNTNIRATRGELNETSYYTFTGTDPRTAAPTGLGANQIGIPQVVGDGSLPHPATVADTDLKPMSQDEFIIGFQKAISKNLAFGMKYANRKINNGMDDYCSAVGINKWAQDKGYTNFDYHTLAQCMLMNPGNDLKIQMDVADDGKLVPVTIPASYLGLAKYSRTYNALEVSLERPFDGKWGLQGSYTFSKSKGTAEGYVQSNLDQEDAGVTQDFDFGSFSDGASGYLPNDRTHAFKLFGNYQLNDNIRFGMNASLSSGRPTSCIGFVPSTAPDYLGPGGGTSGGSGAYSSASSYYCLNKQGVTTLGTRGSEKRTPWSGSLDLSAAYLMKMDNGNKMTFQIDVFNVFNTSTVLEWNEVRDFSRSTSIGTSVASPGKFNSNYQSPTTFQSPRSARLTARYEF
jgi:hypothetical protein